jgi:hypothetical protein
MLERLYGGTGAVAEDPVRIERGAGVEDGGQPALDIGDRRSAVSVRDREDYR